MGYLSAGRELDVIVAEKVMGWKPVDAAWLGIDTGKHDERGLAVCECTKPYDWSPSTDIAAAWEVVEKLNKEKWTLLLEAWDARSEACVEFTRVTKDGTGVVRVNSGVCNTASLAICLAALKVAGHP